MKQKPDNINAAQWQAIQHRGGHLLIMAGPGTGKTHTLTHRILSLANELKVDERILAITFTNKAAREMKERLEKQLAGDPSQMIIGTFHSFCLGLLRENIGAADIPADFKVMPAEDAEELAKEIWKDDSAAERKSKLQEISRWKSSGAETLEPREVAAYRECLRRRHLLDFDDLIFESIQLLRTHADVRMSVQQTYRYICADEYQDINAAQHELLKILGQNSILTAIGDPHQAIYGFRGADVTFFESFTDDFAPSTTLELNENYRSATNILKASSQVIAKNDRFEVPELIAKIIIDGKLTIFEAPTDKAEAEFVVHQIEKLVGGTSMFSIDSGRVGSDVIVPASFRDFAILYRLNTQRHLLEEALKRSGIPYQVSGEKSHDDLLGEQPAPLEDAHVEKVNLLTFHAAKGLEFPVVFLVGCENGLIPLDLKGMTSSREEERRLFYVGMTRAKEKLFLLHAKRRRIYGQALELAPSPFLSDIEEQLKTFELAQRLPERKPKSQERQLSLFEQD